MNSLAHGPRETLGRIVGALWAAPVAAISAMRHARMFHPRGELALGRVEPLPRTPHPDLARRFAGHALVRLSGAVSKKERTHDEVLGIALRVSDLPIVSTAPNECDQDLLFATIVSPLTMPIAPFSTRSDDFLANQYWAVAPFEIEGIGRVKLRLTPAVQAESRSGDRQERLVRGIADHRACFVIEVRRTMHTEWMPVASLWLDALSALDQEALRFDPFRIGRGIQPVGFVHAIRKYVYAASQAVRPMHAG